MGGGGKDSDKIISLRLLGPVDGSQSLSIDPCLIALEEA